MTQISRARQRAALAALITGVDGVDQVFDYPPDADTPTLANACFAVVGTAPEAMLHARSGGSAAVLLENMVTWAVGLTRRTPPVGALDNATRQQLIREWDDRLDAVEYRIYTAAKLTDASGVVALKFGYDIRTLTDSTEFFDNHTLQQAAFLVTGYTIQGS